MRRAFPLDYKAPVQTIKAKSIAKRIHGQLDAGMCTHVAPLPSPPVLCVHPKRRCPFDSDSLSSVCDSHEGGALKPVGEGDQHSSPGPAESDVMDASIAENGAAKAERPPPPNPKTARATPSDKPGGPCGTSSNSHDAVLPRAMNADTATQRSNQPASREREATTGIPAVSAAEFMDVDCEAQMSLAPIFGEVGATATAVSSCASSVPKASCDLDTPAPHAGQTRTASFARTRSMTRRGTPSSDNLSNAAAQGVAAVIASDQLQEVGGKRARPAPVNDDGAGPKRPRFEHPSLGSAVAHRGDPVLRRQERAIRSVDEHRTQWYTCSGPAAIELGIVEGFSFEPRPCANDLLLHWYGAEPQSLQSFICQDSQGQLRWVKIDMRHRHPQLSRHRFNVLPCGMPGWVQAKTVTKYKSSTSPMTVAA
ncbi:hypothetical protein HWV62_28292 [Athelia sp. TMB]|nr:hypothetical protein HWV62_34481 [Athelia sp. TMB]KAF7969123.1 hypothetical protein HWV62_28292 [Athelia sp. TMB]